MHQSPAVVRSSRGETSDDRDESSCGERSRFSVLSPSVSTVPHVRQASRSALDPEFSQITDNLNLDLGFERVM